MPSPGCQLPVNTMASVTDQIKQISVWDAEWEKGEARNKQVKVKDPRCQRNRQLKQVNQISQGKITLENLKESEQPENSSVATFKVS